MAAAKTLGPSLAIGYYCGAHQGCRDNQFHDRFVTVIIVSRGLTAIPVHEETVAFNIDKS